MRTASEGRAFGEPAIGAGLLESDDQSVGLIHDPIATLIVAPVMVPEERSGEWPTERTADCDHGHRSSQST